jgi:predicted RNA-binding Zn-ribbon protein involved in translation (DUF1610 family)
MAARKKINLEKVKASLATPCSNCGYQIPPAEVRRISTTQVRCPKCGVAFTTRASAWKRTNTAGTDAWTVLLLRFEHPDR